MPHSYSIMLTGPVHNPPVLRLYYQQEGKSMAGIWIAVLAGLSLAAAGLLYCCCVVAARADEMEGRLHSRRDE